ncbi:MAG TPA: 30S ribosomal protein S12 methylthiotransferase RimO [Lachnospiraceae bacterium]|nr:30S ribosomal protein S12 methylthiotransferase RimO [Lachnospiraceae bacterium]
MNVFFVSLGCDKNLVDSEEMLGLLVERGIRITDHEENADIIVVNTCGFIHDAMEESVQTLLEMAEYRAGGSCKALIVTGCLAQRFKEDILEEIPEIDAVIGTGGFDRLGQVLDRVLAGEKVLHITPPEGLPHLRSRRVVTTGGHYEYLKIAEGCDKHCTYCVIPYLRGSYRSVPMEQLVEQARRLADGGVSELILVAQETTLYGVELYGEKALHRLLRELCAIPGLSWIRILYCYPEEIYPELIDVMKTEKKICHYLDLPIQHASDRILKLMGRRTTREKLEALIAKLREAMPDIALRTTLITGFPGETQEDHEELLDFIDEMEFDRLGVFTYSREDGTPAAGMDGQIDEEVKEARKAEIMELQQEISLDKGQARIGQIIEAVVEGKVADEDAYVGRTYADTPGVDGYVFIHTSYNLMSGDFVRVCVTGALEYDLIGEIYEEDEYAE